MSLVGDQRRSSSEVEGRVARVDPVHRQVHRATSAIIGATTVSGTTFSLKVHFESICAKRWLKNTELIDLLDRFDHYGFTCCSCSPVSPPSGKIFIFDKHQVRRWRRDGHQWKKKKDGRNVMEHHEKLKVNGIELLNCCYAHHDQIDGFHRRGYWTLDRPNIVLVHYLLQSAKMEDLPQSPNVSISPSMALSSHPGIPRLPDPPIVASRTKNDQYDSLLPGSFNLTSVATQSEAKFSANLIPMSSSMQNSFILEQQFRASSSDQSSKSRADSRKANAARVCRDKKKAYITGLQDQINRLQQQINEIQNRPLQERIAPNDKEQCMQSLRESLSVPDISIRNAIISNLLKQYLTLIMKRKQRSIDSMSLVSTLIAPGTQAKFAMWSLDQHYDTYRGYKGFWTNLLESELGATPFQIEQLRLHCVDARTNRSEYQSLSTDGDQLTNDMNQYVNRSNRVLLAISNLFQPEQLARFILFATDLDDCDVRLQRPG